MIHPDQHAEKIKREHPNECLQTPCVKRLRRHREVVVNREHGADRPVLVIPGRIGHHAQERRDDGRHPETPPENVDHVFRQGRKTRFGEKVFDRRLVFIKERLHESLVDREKPRRDRPVDDPRKRFAVDQLGAAGILTEINPAPFVHERKSDEISRLKPG
ncbi:MAG: hypothetical protein BWY42_00001 [Candidatus Omnitrophica bacterium ADurb.Bin277]|nr:MAG: hypothetical protein BWY42_00001 [Candidatus Omnitrophica bacterium ADurb.Bin277]